MVVGEFTQETDLVVIGGGPGGYTAAFRAAELGIETILIDDRPALGGTCLHEGCVPSKALLHIAEGLQWPQRFKAINTQTPENVVDADAVRGHLQDSIAQLSRGLHGLAKKHRVELIHGRARFDNSRSLTVTNDTVSHIRFKRAIIATGSTFQAHTQLPFDSSRVITPAEGATLPTVPETLLVIGSDYLALEAAAAYDGLGSSVTLITEGDRLLPDADEDLVRVLQRSLSEQCAAIHADINITNVTVDDDRISIQLSGHDDPLSFDMVIVATPLRGNTDMLKLEQTQATVDTNGFIAINEQCRTNDPRIFAVGDVTGPPLLAHRAMQQGRVAAEVISGSDSVYDPYVVPHTIFTNPNIAWCGATGQQLRDDDVSFATAKLPWGASGRAVAMKIQQHGMTKLIYEPSTGRVLGVGLVGHGACELISEAALAIEMGATLTDLAETLHPHPTTAELLADAARTALNDRRED